MDASKPESPAERSQNAHRDAMRAHLSSAKQHRKAAASHRRAAVVEETAASEGVGDEAAHLEAPTVERAASLHASEAADRELDQATIESQRLAHG